MSDNQDFSISRISPYPIAGNLHPDCCVTGDFDSLTLRNSHFGNAVKQARTECLLGRNLSGETIREFTRPETESVSCDFVDRAPLVAPEVARAVRNLLGPGLLRFFHRRTSVGLLFW